MVDLNPGPFVVQGVLPVSHHPCDINHLLWLKAFSKKRKKSHINKHITTLGD